jgi:hypothetical protein
LNLAIVVRVHAPEPLFIPSKLKFSIPAEDRVCCWARNHKRIAMACERRPFNILIVVKCEMKLWDLDEQFVFLLYSFGRAGSAVAAGAQNVQTYFDALNHGGSLLYRAPEIFVNL